jgi:type I restriction enzyme R subunit
MSFQAFEPIAISSESTVVAEFEKETKSSESYQSEDQLEKAFIGLLKEQAYEYLAITEESQLKQNLRESLETLNKITFSDSEWERFFRESVSGEKDGIIEKNNKDSRRPHPYPEQG